MKAKRKGARLNGVSLPALIAEQGLSRSAGYRYARMALGMTIAEARVRSFADLLNKGVPFKKACELAGIHRSTGYRYLRQIEWL